MEDFPRTYPIVRGRSALDVTVSDREHLWNLRVELELVRRFGVWARPEILAALEAEVARLRPRRFRGWLRKIIGRGQPPPSDRRARLEDMCAILYSAMQPVNGETIDRIDREYPDISGELDMSRMKKESKKFQEDVAAELQTAGSPELSAIVQELDESLRDAAAEASDAAPEPVVSTDATESSEPAAIAEDIDALLEEVQAETDEAQGEDILAALSAVEETAENLVDALETSADACLVEAARNVGDANIATTPIEGDQAIESSMDTVADELMRQQEHLDAVASAFSEASQEIDTLNESISEVAAVADESAAGIAEPANQDNDMTTVVDEAISVVDESACVEEEMPAVVDASEETNTMSAPVSNTVSSTAPAMNMGAMTNELRKEIESLKAGVLTQLDRAAALIEQMDGTYQRLEAMTARATQWQQALEEAHQAGRRFAETQAAAVAARGDFEQAQARADEAWRIWHETQHQMTTVASDIHSV